MDTAWSNGLSAVEEAQPLLGPNSQRTERLGIGGFPDPECPSCGQAALRLPAYQPRPSWPDVLGQRSPQILPWYRESLERDDKVQRTIDPHLRRPAQQAS